MFLYTATVILQNHYIVYNYVKVSVGPLIKKKINIPNPYHYTPRDHAAAKIQC